MISEELKSKLRPVTQGDRDKLISVSYSKLDLLKQCLMRYKLKYVDKLYSDQKTLALELGSILHKGLELKGRELIQNRVVDYSKIIDNVMNGCEEQTDKGTERLIGVEEIKKKYFMEWLIADPSSGMNYDQKIKLYLDKVIPTRMQEKDWEVIAVEKNFEFVYDNRCIIHGFIDRVDKKVFGDTVELKVVDYKSSKKVFREEDIKTPLQMVIYDLACLFLYDVIPTYHEYDFILLDKKQTTDDGVCSKGYLKRGVKKLDSLLDKIDDISKTKSYPPSPTPLCYWCSFPDRSYTPNADLKYAGSCQYYSLWKPDQKNFNVHKVFVEGKIDAPKRKLIF